ncbi:MAG: hypothetical protein HYY24_13270 [Verrucomicrobia bacterium]|nr:hypothetical protein [Verrucomicrobiota bacterium]
MLKFLSSCVSGLPWLPALFGQTADRPSRAAGSPVSRRAVEEQNGSCAGETLEKLVYDGLSDGWQPQIVARLKDGQQVILEGFPLRDLARLCMEHNFRWSFVNGGVANGQTRFLLRPGQSPAPVSHRPAGGGSSGD